MRIVVVLVAVVLSWYSPWFASPDDGLVLSVWFNLAPLLIRLWLPAQDWWVVLFLDVAVLAMQYLLLYGVIRAALPLAIVARDFLSAPRHRSGLVR